MTLDELFRDYRKIVVTGGPITGKSIITDAAPASHPVYHSDNIVQVDDPEDLMREKARTLQKQVQAEPRYVVAGVAAHVALKYGLPADCIVVCSKFHGKEAQKPGQLRLSKQAENRSALESKTRGIPIIPFRGKNDFRWDGLKVSS